MKDLYYIYTLARLSQKGKIAPEKAIEMIIQRIQRML